jgi:SAM-dependent methyltransferase
MFLIYLKRFYSYYLLVNNFFTIKLEKIQGIDFSQEHTLEELGLSKDDSVYYGTGGGFRLKRIVSSLKITKNDSFIDFGCGKGKMIFLMSKFSFRKVDGVEISEKLCIIAKNNLKKLKVQNAEIFNSDAKLFDKIDDYNYIYFFNPFSAKVMKDVMKNIEKSLHNVPRALTIIYFNPVCHKEIMESGIFINFKNRWNVSLYKNMNI